MSKVKRTKSQLAELYYSLTEKFKDTCVNCEKAECKMLQEETINYVYNELYEEE